MREMGRLSDGAITSQPFSICNPRDIVTRIDFDWKNLAADIGASVTMALVALPANAVMLIMSGVGVSNLEEIKDIWDVSLVSRLVMLVTFLSTLVLDSKNR